MDRRVQRDKSMSFNGHSFDARFWGPLLLAFRQSAQTHLTGPARPAGTAPVQPAR